MYYNEPLTLDNMITPPAAPVLGKSLLYSISKATRAMAALTQIGAREQTLGPHLGLSNLLGFFGAFGTTTPTYLGMTAPTAIGTATARSVAFTNTATRMPRIGYASAATPGSLCGLYETYASVYTSDGAGNGGFFFTCRFAVSDPAAVTPANMFIGLSNNAAAPTNVVPNTLLNCLGIGKITSSNNLCILQGGTTASAAIDLGTNFPAAPTGISNAYEFTMFSPGNSQVIYWQVTRLDNGNQFTASGTFSGTQAVNLPSNSLPLAARAWRCNNSMALAVGLDIGRYTLEHDY